MFDCGQLQADDGAVHVAHDAERGRVRRSGLARHDYVALAFYTGGSAKLLHQDQRLDVREGEAYLVPAGDSHGLVEARDRSAWGLRFRPATYAASDLEPLLEPLERVRSGASPVIPIPSSRQQHLAYLFAELRAQLTERARSADAAVVQKSLLGLILAEVKRAAVLSSTVERQTTIVGDALAFIERHCLEPISSRDVADAVHRSTAHVTTTLRKATGKSAGAWIIAGRMAEARNRLAHTDEPVDIVAERIGYADATHFIRLFRRTYGVTPAAFRNQVRAQRSGVGQSSAPLSASSTVRK